MYNYTAKVVRVVDADTFDAAVDLGFHITVNERFRVLDYDAPETWRPRNEAEREHGEAATKRAVELLQDKLVILDTFKNADIYARWTAKVMLPDRNDYASLMISEGFAKRDSYEGAA